MTNDRFKHSFPLSPSLLRVLRVLRASARILPGILFVSLLLAIPPILGAQTSEQNLTRRIVWRGGEHALRYAVEIDRSQYGIYRNHLREFTTALYIVVSLPPGDYRFRIIPHDILDRPGEGTQWMHFEVRPAPVIAESFDSPAETEQVIDIGDFIPAAPEPLPAPEPAPTEQETVIAQDEPERIETTRPRSNLFNTIGVSIGSCFIIDPIAIASVHGTIAPVRNMFIELGCDFGFFSTYKDVKNYYSIYPFASLGAFVPFNSWSGFFLSAGAGFMFGNYTFDFGKAGVSVFGIHFTGGVNLFNFLNLSYTLRTDMDVANSKFAIGVVYRFK